jgi:hypothetical protein
MTPFSGRHTDARTAACARSEDWSERGEADDALILTRALLSLVARSLYMVQPDDTGERERRASAWRRSWARDALRTVDDLAAAGFSPDDDRERLRRMAEDDDVPLLPPDRQILQSLGLEVYHARVYRLASDVVHYSMGSALDGFVEYPNQLGGGRVWLKRTDADGAEEALTLATIIYGEFLERSEPLIGHGVTLHARQLLAEHLNAKAAESGNG